MRSSIIELEKKISNIDNHIVLTLNILKQALSKGDVGIVKLGTGFMEYAESAKIFDMKPSSGKAMDHATIFSRAPADVINKTVISLRDKRIEGPWSTWLVIRSE